MKTSIRLLGLGTLLLVLLASISACKHSDSRPDIKTEMRDSYAASYALFRDIWSGTRFKTAEQSSEAVRNIDRLLKNFHGVDQKTENTRYDSGFFLALELNRDYLLDAKRRLQQGHVDYATWRLKGMMHNCIACHTRYQAPVKFVGEVPAPESDSAESMLDVADFLVATRQFEKASDVLLKLTSAPGGMSFVEQPEFRALKLWLVVQMRETKNFQSMIAKLTELSKLGKFRGEAAVIVDHWLIDLKRFSGEVGLRNTIQDAEILTSGLNNESGFTQDDLSLVSTLYATNILHNSLPSLNKTSRQKALFLLGLAYHHIQVQQLNVFRGLYLEQCIKEFPHTDEARKAFELFEEEIEFLSSGSDGINIEEEDRKTIDSLRALASQNK